MKERKLILHLCADLGSDSYFYQQDDNFEVRMIGENIGVENYHTTDKVYGIIANPVCTEFSTAKSFSHVGDLQKGMFLVNHCLRIIKETNPEFWVIENPFNGRLKEFLGKPDFVYQPYQFGSPWTKKTALWGKFNAPTPTHTYDECEKLDLYIRSGRKKTGLVYLHKNDIHKIPEFAPFVDYIKCDADLRSLCSHGFAKAFYELNK